MIHIGCHLSSSKGYLWMRQGLEAAVEMIAGALNEVMWADMHTTILLETMAGKGSEVGRSFEELRAIIDRVECSDRIGVCMDTCHVYDAGYDIVQNLDEVVEQFGQIVGLDRLKAMHLNDSKNPYESHKDRHEKIGQGSLGLETFRAVVNHPMLKGLPFILETPHPDNDGYAEEIRLLRGMEKSGT